MKEQLDLEYRSLHGVGPDNDFDAVYFLGDSAGYRTWSVLSNKIPTLRMASGLFWWPALQRFSTDKEKLSFLGMPVDPAHCEAMGVPCMGTLDSLRALQFAGNAMNLSNVAVAELVALCCFAEKV